MAGGLNLPPYAGNPRRKSTTKDVEQRSQLLLRRSTSDGNWYFSPARKQWPHREKNASYVAASVSPPERTESNSASSKELFAASIASFYGQTTHFSG